MPPLSYIIKLVVLIILIALSMPLTLGFSIIVWYWLIAAAGCALAIAGAIKISKGIQAPAWVGLSIAAPGIVWMANKLYDIPFSESLTAFMAFDALGSLALVAASAGAIRIVEIGSHIAFHIAYGVLAAGALLICSNLLIWWMGWHAGSSPAYALLAQIISVSAAIIKYGSFIAAAVLGTLRWNIEKWAGISISLISAILLYQTVRLHFVAALPTETMFWLQPIMMLIGGAAVWRIGSVLNSRTPTNRPIPAPR